MARRSQISRRKALGLAAQGLGATSVLAAGSPAIVPASVFGATAPSNRINVGAIGNKFDDPEYRRFLAEWRGRVEQIKKRPPPKMP